MTDRFNGVVVTFEVSMREDDAEGLIEAIKHLRGVVGVEPVRSENLVHEQTVRSQVNYEWRKRLIELLEHGGVDG